MILNNERCCHCLLDEINLSTSLGAGVANKLHGINQIKRNSSITYIGLCYSNIVLEIITQSDLGLISVGGGAGSHQNCNFLRFMRQSKKRSPQGKMRLCDDAQAFLAPKDEKEHSFMLKNFPSCWMFSPCDQFNQPLDY